MIDLTLTDSDAERFWANVDKSGECWVWKPSEHRNGYGMFRLRGTPRQAHRISLANTGVDVTGRVVRHSCDNPPCVNPSHLLPGTYKDNSDDMWKRGRGHQSLTNEQVEDIRSRPLTNTICRDISKEFDIPIDTARDVLEGNTYTWLPGGRQLPPQFKGWTLTPEQVAEIWEEAKNPTWGWQNRLAKKFGVGRATINHVVKGRLKYSRLDTE